MMGERAATALWIVRPGVAELRDENLPPVDPGRLLLRTLYSGISRGTESLVFAGRIPASQYEAMRAPFQAGDFPGPVKYGYQSVAVVEEGPPALRGRIVFCLHPHQTAYAVPLSAAVAVPDGVPPERAVLAANMETAVNGVWDADVQIGDRVAVVGAGAVGCLVAYLAGRLPGTEVELIDIDAGKAAVAARLGVGFAVPDRAAPEADVVIHASGSPEGLATALGLAANEATVVEMSWFGDRPVPLPLGEAFHARRLTIRSSQVGQVPAAKRSRMPHRRRLALALSLLADDALDALITGESPFAELPQVLARLAAAPAGALCHRIRYPA